MSLTCPALRQSVKEKQILSVFQIPKEFIFTFKTLRSPKMIFNTPHIRPTTRLTTVLFIALTNKCKKQHPSLRHLFYKVLLHFHVGNLYHHTLKAHSASQTRTQVLPFQLLPTIYHFSPTLLAIKMMHLSGRMLRVKDSKYGHKVM